MTSPRRRAKTPASGSIGADDLEARCLAAEKQVAELRELIEAGVALATEPTIDTLLQRLVDTAASVMDAEYAALGVLDERRRSLERFVTHGISPEERARLGPSPVGRGLLGALISDPQPLRLRDIHEDPRSVGFPPGHPPMRTFLGVPVVMRGVPYGNLYLTEKRSGEFTDHDVSVAQLLAAQAAAAIENMRLYETAREGLRQAEALAAAERRLGETVDPREICQVLATSVAEVVGARVVIVATRSGLGLRVEAAAGDGDAGLLLGRAQPSNRLERLLARKSSDRVDDLLSDPEADRAELSEIARATGAAPRTAMYAVLSRQGAREAAGLVSAFDRAGAERFAESDLRMLSVLASRAAIALELSDRVGRESLTRVLEAQEAERRRLARELHDETAQALGAVKFVIGNLADAPPEERAQLAAEARALVQAALADVRAVASQLRPSLLDDFGLEEALEHLASQTAAMAGFSCSVRVVAVSADLPVPLSTTIFRIAQEGLSNVARHAEARKVTLTLTGAADGLLLEIRDDGRGFDPRQVDPSRLGVAGIRERVDLFRGEFTIESAPDGGTTVRAWLPHA